jgi:hypothetical protein
VEMFSLFYLCAVIACRSDALYDTSSVASIEDGLTGMRIRGCAALGEGRTCREAEAQSLWASSYVCMGGSRVAEQGGGATKSPFLREGGARMRPSSSEVFHAGLALHSSCLLLGGACGRCGR